MRWADLGEVDADCVVMPLAVTHLWDLPAPLGRLEGVHVHALAWLLTQQKHQPAVVDKQGVMVAVHLWNKHHRTYTKGAHTEYCKTRYVHGH